MDSAELTRMYDFTGRTVVVTGGTGVLGRAMVEALVGCGAGVALLARNREKADALVSELKGPGRAVVFNGDATRREDLERAAREVVEEFGRVDCLLNGAGGNHPRATTSAELSFFDIPEEAIRFVFDLNLLGTILPSQVFGRLRRQMPNRRSVLQTLPGRIRWATAITAHPLPGPKRQYPRNGTRRRSRALPASQVRVAKRNPWPRLRDRRVGLRICRKTFRNGTSVRCADAW